MLRTIFAVAISGLVLAAISRRFGGNPDRPASGRSCERCRCRERHAGACVRLALPSITSLASLVLPASSALKSMSEHRLCRILRQPRRHGEGHAAFLPARSNRGAHGKPERLERSRFPDAQGSGAAEKVARYRHAQLSAIKLAGDIKAKVTDGASLDEPLVKIKSEVVKLGPLIDLDAIREPAAATVPTVAP